MPHQLGKILWPLLFLIAGGIAAYFLYGIESARVAEHLLGYPTANVKAHEIRPWLLVLLCLLPGLGAILYYSSTILDRYLTRELLLCFGICFFAFLAMLILMELQNHGSNLKEATTKEVIGFYLIQIPGLLMMILPYSLMLSLLWCLGKLSKSQEIVSMIQSGRSVLRLMAPLIVVGLFLTLITTIFSYHWAPFGEGYKRSMLKELKGEPNTAAVNVGHGNPKTGRMWTVGRFPRKFAQGEALEKVTVWQHNKEEQLVEKYSFETALWEKKTGVWTMSGVTHWKFIDDNGQRIRMPLPVIHESLELQLPETPWQIIRPGLEPTHLGIPELTSWINNHPDHILSNKRSYRTYWHFRWAQPVICIIIVILAAPLGISFSRRGAVGGVAVAIFLCAGMLFCSTVFPTLGESGNLPPALAAWATNIIFFAVAAILFYRRISGRPIYQTLKRFSPIK